MEAVDTTEKLQTVKTRGGSGLL